MNNNLGTGINNLVNDVKKNTVGEDMHNFYLSQFFKEANGDRNQFIQHFLNRFGVPKGSSRKREEDYFGKRFDEMLAKQNKEQI